MHVKTPFLHWFNGPMKDDESALKFFKVELNRMIKAMESHYGVKITPDKLKAAIKESNEIKKSLQRISALRNTVDMPNHDYLRILKRCMQSDKGEIISFLNGEISRLEKAGPFPKNKRRILLTGSDVTYEEWMDLLDECGLRIVRDDLSIGERYFATLIPEEGDPFDALAKYYLNIPKPATKLSMQKRIDFLLKSLGETPVEAVISQNLKFCEPYAYDSVLVNEAIKKGGYKLFHLEREFTATSDQQMLNRLMAFTELL
jgi:benzoyl-CoA reductase/2-hydroxyglutaryl-CoA dehydratase subunit BcrC/BadD/HgdB